MNPEGREILPQVAFSGFRQRYREPKMSEGFEDIARVEFQVCFIVVFLIVARALPYRLLLSCWGFLFVAVLRTSSVMIFWCEKFSDRTSGLTVVCAAPGEQQFEGTDEQKEIWTRYWV